MSNMLSICLCFLVALSKAALPDPPKVTVPKDVLKDFGVTIDPNAPGLFNKLMSNVTAAREVDAIQRGTSRTRITVIVDIEDYSARDLVSFLEELPIKEHSQFAVAHMLNIYFRLYNFTQEFQNGVTQSIRKFNDAKSSEASKICREDTFLNAIARQYSQDFNTATACPAFQALLSKELILSKKLSDVSFAAKTLQKLDSLLDDKDIPLGEVKRFMLTAPHLPKLFQGIYYEQILGSFSDYIEFIKKIETEKEGQKDLKKVLSFVKMQLLYNLKVFWDLSSELDG